jgi:hypothetical protein
MGELYECLDSPCPSKRRRYWLLSVPTMIRDQKDETTPLKDGRKTPESCATLQTMAALPKNLQTWNQRPRTSLMISRVRASERTPLVADMMSQYRRSSLLFIFEVVELLLGRCNGCGNLHQVRQPFRAFVH